MNWSSWSTFLAMGGYALYVWGAFGVAAAALVLEVWQLRLRSRALARRESYGMDGRLPHETQT
jgi:heme exporter protein D